MVTGACNREGDRVAPARCAIVATVTHQMINPPTVPGVIVPPRERPVAERTMCDDGNDAP
ncbi:hypothetical protein EAD98_15680 [Micromonospora sp. CV4]|nr:hypothetical protein EAD98_15680 [Micromonospora sp. CV4]